MSRKIYHRFFVPQRQMDYPAAVIKGPDVNHIKNVLRLKPGDRLQLVDGTGGEYISRITGLLSSRIDLEIFDTLAESKESPVCISVAQSYLKEKKMDLLVRQLTELGISQWYPFFSKRSVPVPDEKRLVSRQQRWRKITIEAVKQCRRNRLMAIGRPGTFQEMLVWAKTADVKIIFWENADGDLGRIGGKSANIQSVFAVLGPEGGFTDEEISQAAGEGFLAIRMGPRVMRAETAAVAACSLLQYRFGDFGEKSLDKLV